MENRKMSSPGKVKKIRQRALPAGWYPEGEAEIRGVVDEWQIRHPASKSLGSSGIVPHAGWYYSGELAFSVLSRFRSDLETIVVIGGHLPATDSIKAYAETGAETPLGPIETDLELLEEIRDEFSYEPDSTPDNTVEIQLPLVKYLYPRARYVGLRAPPAKVAIHLGEYLAERSIDKNLGVVGSTDLTHYGPAYGHSNHGSGRDAYAWARDENDKQFIDAMVSLDLSLALQLAEDHRSACSAGGAVAAGAFARSRGIGEGVLVGYDSSYRRRESDSFVGYCGIIYESS